MGRTKWHPCREGWVYSEKVPVDVLSHWRTRCDDRQWYTRYFAIPPGAGEIREAWIGPFNNEQTARVYVMVEADNGL